MVVRVSCGLSFISFMFWLVCPLNWPNRDKCAGCPGFDRFVLFTLEGFTGRKSGPEQTRILPGFTQQFIEKMQSYTDCPFSGDEDNKLWTFAYDDFDTSLYSLIFPTSTPPHHFPGTPNTASPPLPPIVLDYNHVSMMASICILLGIQTSYMDSIPEHFFNLILVHHNYRQNGSSDSVHKRQLESHAQTHCFTIAANSVLKIIIPSILALTFFSLIP
ncbi:hypothetical protein LXL04_032517 [Taraxacum kok-saghyz]